IRLCNPAFSLEPLVKDIWLNWNGFSNIGVLIVHITINFVVKPNDKRNRELGRVVMHSEQKRVCLCMMCLTIAFVSTWGTCMLSQCIVTWMEPSLATKVVHAYSAIFAMMAYSMNYYVYIIRNEKYRRAFLEQLSCVLPERLHPSPSISSRGALSSHPTFVRNSSHGSGPPSFHAHYQQRHGAGDSRASSTHSHHQYHDNHGANLSSKPSIHSLHAKYRQSNRREPQHSRDTSVTQEDVKELS
ncbi:unnamed protein product, partial [Heligmosomoides polygyrus]|uniref:G_PROTEIN_RECEP_F2_4 domain-containing protein n=1 Tax=Heligmosomoides polygyrus TaxID=6339 RepID=A0A183F987_HELPZ